MYGCASLYTYIDRGLVVSACVCVRMCVGGCKYFMRESWVRKDPHLLLLVKVEMFK